MADRPGGLDGALSAAVPVPPDAFIQAGGQSSRMGTNKALLEVGGRTFLERVADAARPVAASVVLVTNEPDTYARFGLPTVPDRYPGGAALGGIATALAEAQTPRALVLACDLPFLTPELLRYLVELDPAADVTVPATVAEGPHPLCAVYARSCLPHIEPLLAAGRLKVTGFFAAVRVRRVGEEEMRSAGLDPGRLLRNVNTPGELEEARRSLADAGRSSP